VVRSASPVSKGGSMDIVFVGLQGAGKGSQADVLAEILGLKGAKIPSHPYLNHSP
jgi:signal recognition particle GTPase